jgi:hypothetical protein
MTIGLAVSIQVRLVRHAHELKVDPNLVLSESSRQTCNCCAIGAYRSRTELSMSRMVHSGADREPGARRLTLRGRMSVCGVRLRF